MKLSIFGMGYVGCVSAACFARAGHNIIGVDINPAKAEMINSKRSPIVEEGIAELIEAGVSTGRLRATTDSADAVLNSDISLVCVGTPSKQNGSLDLSHLRKVCQDIGEALKIKDSKHFVVIRSTVLPGTIENVLIPEMETSSNKKAQKHFFVSVNPEFLREGSSINDFYNPPLTLIGAEDSETVRILQSLYAAIEAPIFVTSLKTAEMVKYVCNCFHALKVAFTNEIGNVCKAMDIDSHEVMELFCKDTKLNLSASYLKPGFAFGGSCLPKDLRAVCYRAKELDLEVPVLSAILPSNRLQIEKAVKMVLGTSKKRIGVLGLSFKAGTDDLRESPMVTLVETLIGKGLQVAIYDRDVSLGQLFGANKDYIEREIPHISHLMKESIKEVVDSSELLIIGNKADEFLHIGEKLRSDQSLIDLVRLFDARRSDQNYLGICW